MATTMVKAPVAAEPADPFRYGWRDVERRAVDGRVIWERVPLTLADILHPQEGDTHVHGEPHERHCTYLYDVFSAQLADDPTAVVLHDVGVEWDEPALKHHSPDLTVILGVRERQEWAMFNVASEQVRPAMLLEVTSPNTARVDRTTKVKHYARARVPLYIIVDSITRQGRRRLRLIGYELVGEHYQRLAPNERGWLWLAPVRVWLGIENNEVVCYNEAGAALGNYVALTAAIGAAAAAQAAAEQVAQAERQARTAAEQVAEAERQARTATQAAAEQAVAAERQARATAEQAAATERQARAAAEVAQAEATARLRALEVELRRLRGE